MAVNMYPCLDARVCRVENNRATEPAQNQIIRCGERDGKRQDAVCQKLVYI